MINDMCDMYRVCDGKECVVLENLRDFPCKEDLFLKFKKKLHTKIYPTKCIALPVGSLWCKERYAALPMTMHMNL